nr:MAG TPA: hypothetical protein [Caudoviricetes sp.]
MSFEDDMKKAAVQSAALSYTDALNQDIVPEQAAKNFAVARQFGITPTEAAQMTPKEVAIRQAQDIDYAAMQATTPVYLQRIVADPEKAQLVKDDIASAGLLEQAIFKMTGSPYDDTRWFKDSRNAIARGSFGLFNAMPGLGNIGKLDDAAARLERLDQMTTELREGKTPMEVFGIKDENIANIAMQFFTQNIKGMREELQKQQTQYATQTATANRMSALFPESEAKQEFAQQTELGDSASYILTHPGIVPELFWESFIQYAPAMPSIGLASALAGPMGAAAVTGAYSYGLDRNSTLMGKINEEGKGGLTAEDIQGAISDPAKLAEFREKAALHAGPVALLDAVSAGLASKTLLPKALHAKLSAPARIMAESVVQAPIQGVLGGTGEALGQIASEGRITSWSDVLAEVVGEFTTAPQEIATAGHRAYMTRQVEKAKAEVRTQNFKDLGQLARENVLAERAPDVAESYFQEVGDAVGHSEVYIDAQAVQDAGLAEALVQLSPSAAAQFQGALQSGSEIAIPAGEYLMRIARSDINDDLAPLLHLADEPSLYQMEGMEDEGQASEQAPQEGAEEPQADNPVVDIADAVSQAIDQVAEGLAGQQPAEQNEQLARQNAQSAEQNAQVAEPIANRLERVRPKETPSEIKALTKEIASVFEKSGAPQTEQAAMTGLCLSLAMTAAQDLGMTPTEFWRAHGLKQAANPEQAKAAGVAQNNGSKGEFFPGQNIIVRWASADPSTLVHESGHWFLHNRIKIAEDLENKAKTQALTDGEKHYLDATKAALKWLGVSSFAQWDGMTLEEQRPLHEKFARTFEAYLMEGRAPTRGLRALFRQFSNFLKKVYYVLSGIPGAELNPQTKELFDNLFIAYEQVTEAKMRRQMFDLMEALGGFATGPLLQEYEDAMQERDAAGYEYLVSALVKNMHRQGRLQLRAEKKLTRDANEARKQFAQEERARFKKTRVGALLSFLRDGEEQADGSKYRPKLTKSELSKLGFTDEEIETLKKAKCIYVHTKGTVQASAQDLARDRGYTSADEMVKDLLANADIDAIIDARVQQRMDTERSEIATPEAITKLADEAVSQDAGARVVAIEINALERTQNRTVDAAFFADLARESLQGLAIGNIHAKNYRNQAASLARKALTALKNGDLKGAAFYKRQELYQLCLANEATKIEKQRERAEKLYKRIKNRKEIKGTSTRYLIMAQRLLDAAGYGVPRDLLRDSVSIESFKDECKAQGEIIPNIEDDLASRLSNGFGTQHSEPKNLSVELHQELEAAVRQLMKLGRDVNTVELAGETIELDTVAVEISDGVIDNAKKHGRKIDGSMEGQGFRAKARDAIRKLGAVHARIPSLLACMDGKRFGPLYEAIVRPADRASEHEEKLKAEFAKKLFKPFKILRRNSFEKARYYDFAQSSFTRSQVIAMALNMGNEGNFERLVSGSDLWKGATGGRKLTAAEIFQIVEQTLTKEELEAVQEVWNVFAELQPEVMAQAKRLTGRTPELVPPRPVTFQLADGTVVNLKGGYYPIVYDRLASRNGQVLADMKDALSQVAAASRSQHTAKGFLEKRAKKVEGLAVSLTTRGAFEGLDAEIHRLSWEEWVVDSGKILKRISPTLADYWGMPAVKAIDKWRQDIATGNSSQSEGMDAVARVLASGVSVAALGFNIVTALVQPIGIINTTAVIGHKWTAKGLARFLSMGPKGAYDFVVQRSFSMENRTRTRFRELAEIQAYSESTVGQFRDSVARYSYSLIVFTQMLVDIPTWLGGYEKALSEGHTEAEAIDMANRVVVDAQGGGRKMDLAEIERGGAVSRLLTVFYTFFNSIYNNIQVSGHTKNKAAFAADVLLLLCFQPVIETFLREGIKAGVAGADPEDWWEKSVEQIPSSILDFNLGLLVVTRELSGLTDSYTGPSGFKKPTDIHRFAQQAIQGDFDMAFWKSLTNMMGGIFGLPAAPITRAMTGLDAIDRGKTDNPLAIIFGYSEY